MQEARSDAADDDEQTTGASALDTEVAHDSLAARPHELCERVNTTAGNNIKYQLSSPTALVISDGQLSRMDENTTRTTLGVAKPGQDCRGKMGSHGVPCSENVHPQPRTIQDAPLDASPAEGGAPQASAEVPASGQRHSFQRLKRPFQIPRKPPVRA
jgi:hypothetical protein